MTRKIRHGSPLAKPVVFRLFLMTGGLCLGVGLGCSNTNEKPFAPDDTDADASANTSGGAGSDGASGGNGGTTPASGGAGGTPSSGGSSAGGTMPFDAASLYECQARPPRDPGGTGTEGSSCCILDTGTCTDPSDIPDPVLAQAYGHDSCSSDLVCVPTDAALADAGGLGVFEVCSWVVGSQNLEGRCLPACFVQGHPSENFLTQGSCREQLVCAPCFNPIDGSSTGACTIQPGDMAVESPPTPFATCGATPEAAPPGPSGGLCVPEELLVEVDNAAISLLTQLECAAGEICAPALKVNDTSACFAQCETALRDLFGEAYVPGGCVPSYVIGVVAPVGLGTLTQGECAEGELCAPCLNPLGTPADSPSGACQ